MVRRLKADVLQELPAKQRQVIELPVESSAVARVIAGEQARWAEHEERLAALRAEVELSRLTDRRAYADAVAQLRRTTATAFEDMSKTRQAVALAKVPQAIAHIEELLEETAKVVVFCHHREVLAKLMAGLQAYRPVKVEGGMGIVERNAAVEAFQKQAECRVFVGTIYAAGTGLTLTEAANVVMVELDWVPGIVSQAEDRCHRIGQLEQVLVQHLVLEGSMDVALARALVEKQAVADAALDDQAAVAPGGADDALVGMLAAAEEAKAARARRDAERAAWAAGREQRAEQAKEYHTAAKVEQRSATYGRTSQEMAAIGARMTGAQIAAVHAALRLLASHDGDWAQIRNEVGFNKADGYLGHLLAERSELSPQQAAVGRLLVHKYGRQIGDRLRDAMGQG
jgi:hypothetical protein